MNNTEYCRPAWTCGRYNKDKHVAIMYNLMAGFSFFFENYSADVIGLVLSVGRNGILDVSKMAEQTGVAIESIESFFKILVQNGLLTEHVYTEGEMAEYRRYLVKAKRNQPSWVDESTEQKLPMSTSNAEKMYYDAVDDGKTVCSCMFELTYRCSEMCIHCYNPGATRNDAEVSHRGDRQELNLDDYKRIIDEMDELGLVKVCLSGGDPFSKEFVWDIIDYLYKKEIAFDIFTNGQRLVKDVRRLADYYPRLVGVSIYSGVAADHDAITRIPGSWKRSMQVVKELSELAVPMNLKCCVMQPNLHSYYMVADIAKQYGAQPQFEINITESTDGDVCAKQLRLTEEQLQVVLRDKDLSLYVGKEVPNYGSYPIIKNRRSCNAATYTFCMTPDGSIRPCCSFPLDFGNLKERTVLTILSTSVLLKEWRNCTVESYEECGAHPYCDFCSLCAGLNFIEHNDYRKAAESNCYMAKVRYSVAKKLQESVTSNSRDEFFDSLHKLSQESNILHRQYKNG